MRRASCLVLLMLAACSGGEKPPAGPPQDQVMARHEQAGKIAYDLDRPEEAVAQFEAALKQAQARAELIRRGSQPPPALLLAEATAQYRLGDRRGADALAATVETGADPDAAAGASFLRGLIADENNDVEGLRAAANRLSGVSAPLRIADRLELQARLALRNPDLAAARAAALQAASIRQESLDYRGMARALAVAGLATERAGERELAADLYLRAGRSAAAQSDAETAKPWLERVLQLTQDDTTKQAAEMALADLE